MISLTNTIRYVQHINHKKICNFGWSISSVINCKISQDMMQYAV